MQLMLIVLQYKMNQMVNILKQTHHFLFLWYSESFCQQFPVTSKKKY